MILGLRMMMMVMTMMLPMMIIIEMLALPMRCLLNTFTLCHLWQKGEVVLDMKVVTFRERVSFWDHFVRGSVIILRDVMRISCIFSFLSVLDTLILVHEVLWPFIDIHCTYFLLYIDDVCFSFTYPFMCCLFSLFIHMLLIICMQSYYSVSHKDALMSFV